MNKTRKFFSDRRPRVIAHRGDSSSAPENTALAFRLARTHADIFEFDVRLTADGKVVVIHDAKVDRTTDGSGAVSRMRLVDLLRLDAGYRFNGEHGRSYARQGIRIPLLEDVLAEFEDMPMNIEFKSSEPQVVAATLELLDRFGRLNDGSVVLTSFNHSVLRRVRRLAPKLATGSSRRENFQLFAATALNAPRLFRGHGKSFQLPMRKWRTAVTTPGTIAMAHRLGLEVHTYTADEEADMRRLISFGVDGLFTNQPARMRSLIDRK